MEHGEDDGGGFQVEGADLEVRQGKLGLEHTMEGEGEPASFAGMATVLWEREMEPEK